MVLRVVRHQVACCGEPAAPEDELHCRQIDALVAHLQQAGVRARGEIRTTPRAAVAEEVCAAVRESGCGLIVLDAPAGPFRRLRGGGGLVRELLARAGCPLLLVPTP